MSWNNTATGLIRVSTIEPGGEHWHEVKKTIVTSAGVQWPRIENALRTEGTQRAYTKAQLRLNKCNTSAALRGVGYNC